MTMNDTWGYKTNDHNWKQPEVLINMLIETSSKGGNFLLNIGPDERGNIPAPTVNALLAAADWMDVNSESIYGTEASLFEELKFGRSTTKVLENGNTRLYFHVQKWPENGELTIPSLENKVLKASVLGSDEAISAEVLTEGVVIKGLPKEPVGEFGAVVVVEVLGTVPKG